MILLTGSSPKLIASEVGIENYRKYFGSLNSPRASYWPGHANMHGVPWAIDNDAFKRFDETRFLSFLNRIKGIPNCLFVNTPDVVGNAYSTLLMFSHWQPIIRMMEFPVALVAQDGLQHLIIPWDSFDTLFIGGSTIWKEGMQAALIAKEAKHQGKWLHMGRVNGMKRLRYARYLGCDSVDGTHWIHEPSSCRDALALLARPFEPVVDHYLQPYLMEVS